VERLAKLPCTICTERNEMKNVKKIIIQIGNKIKSDKDKITGINFNLLIPTSLCDIINLS
jgi:hypothetical protein